MLYTTLYSRLLCSNHKLHLMASLKNELSLPTTYSEAECTRSELGDNPKQSGAADTTKGRDAIQMDLDRIENLM